MNIFELSRWVHPEESQTLTELFRNAASAARSRQFLQGLGVSTAKPVVDSLTRQQIDIFFHDARQGFVTSFRGNFPGALQLLSEYNDSSVLDGAVSDELAAMGFDWKPTTLDLESSPRYLTAYATLQTTLGRLRQERIVTYAQFRYKPDRLELGQHEISPSFWHRDLAPGVIWDTISRLHRETESILNGAIPVTNEVLLFTGHFFTAGLNLIKEISR